METVLAINEDGDIAAIYSDDLLPLMDEGSATVTRASHVEPAAGGGWYADLAPAGGPYLDGFKTRREALDAEVAWLTANRIAA